MDAVFHSQLRFHLTESGFHGRRNRRNNFRSSVVRYGAVRLKITRLLESRVPFSFFFLFTFPDRSPLFLLRQHGKLVNEDVESLEPRFAFGFANFEFVGHTAVLCHVKSPMRAASCVCADVCRDVSSRGKLVSLNRCR